MATLTKILSHPIVRPRLVVYPDGNRVREFTLACGRVSRRTVRKRPNNLLLPDQLVRPKGSSSPFLKPSKWAVNCHCQVCLTKKAK